MRQQQKIFFTWERDSFDKWVYKFISYFLDNIDYHEYTDEEQEHDDFTALEDIPNQLLKLATERWVTLNSKRIEELKKMIGELEYDEEVYWNTFTNIPGIFVGRDKILAFASHLTWEEIWTRDWNDPDIAMKIRHALLLKFIDLIEALYQKNDRIAVVNEITSIVSSVLSKTEDYSHTFTAWKSVYNIQQFWDWDIKIERSDVKNIDQSDLFFQDEGEENNTLTLDTDSLESMFLYQRSSWLYSMLLFYCYKHEFYPEGIDALSDINSQIPHTWDALDTRDGALYLRYAIENDTDSAIKNMIWIVGADAHYWYVSEIVSHGWWTTPFVEIYKSYSKKYCNARGRKQIREFVLRIKQDEIWAVLAGLYKLPARSKAEIDTLLGIFKQKYEEKYWK